MKSSTKLLQNSSRSSTNSNHLEKGKKKNKYAKDEIRGMKRAIKIIAAILAALVLTIGFSACGSANSPEAAVKGAFDAVKKQDLEKAEKYVDLTDTRAFITEKTKVTDTDAVLKEIGKKLEYEIISTEQVDENTAKVKTKVTSIDMTAVMKNYFSQNLQNSISAIFGTAQQSTEENKVDTLFMQCLSAESVGTVTKEAEITVKKGEGGWKVSTDSTFNDAFLGGLKSTAETILSAVNDSLTGNSETEKSE